MGAADFIVGRATPVPVPPEGRTLSMTREQRVRYDVMLSDRWASWELQLENENGLKTCRTLDQLLAATRELLPDGCGTVSLRWSRRP